MLNLIAKRCPSDLKEAFQLAWEPETIAPCTTILPGVCLHEHARALMFTKKWFLHERP